MSAPCSPAPQDVPGVARPLLPASSVGDFSAARALAGVAKVGLVGVGQLLLVAVLGRGVACPLREWTGLRCPLCGTTTAALHLLSGRWQAAWHANAFTLLLGVGLAGCVVLWLVELAGGPAVRPPRCLRPLTAGRVLALLAVAGVLFAAGRNLA